MPALDGGHPSLSPRSPERIAKVHPHGPPPPAGDEDELCEMVALSPAGRCATMCLFGCISVMGCRSSLVRRLSFYPPFPAGYSIAGEKLYIQDTFHGCAGGRSFRAAGDEQLVRRPKPREGQETIQELLARNQLPERVKVCMVPRGRRKKLAAVLLWTTAGVPMQQADDEDQAMEFALSNRQLVIFSHGNSTDIGYMFGLHYRMCFRCQVNVLAYDYSGYGWSDGKATEAALYKDVQTIYKYAVTELKVAPHNIILVCSCSFSFRSFASFAALGSRGARQRWLRSQLRLRGSPQTGMPWWGLRLFINNIDRSPWFDAFRNVEKLKKVHDIPMLLIHGRLDRQVPFSHSVKLELSCREADALREQHEANSKKHCWMGSAKGSFRNSALATPVDPGLQRQRVQTWWVANADHNDVENKAGDEYYRRISAFLAFCSKWHAQRKVLNSAG
ncbi:hypothetical protein ACSSS7_006100 [Eimeria intestinalis]